MTVPTRGSQKRKRNDDADNDLRPMDCVLPPFLRRSERIFDRKQSQKRDHPEQKEDLPPLKSFYLRPSNDETMLQLRELMLNFAIRLIEEDFESIIDPVKPYTNSGRYSHQTPQAIRIFFGKQVKGAFGNLVVRYIYGPAAVLRTTGYDINEGFRVRPFSDELNAIVKLLIDKIKASRPKLETVDFNFLEIKLYQGKNMLKGIKDANGNALRTDCNKIVNHHNDLQFEDDGKQNDSDTVDGKYPVAAFTVGAPRELEFIRIKKRCNTKWHRHDKNKSCIWTLRHGSVWVLLPEDEIPQLVGKHLYKVKHGVKMVKEDGISMGFVFRKIKETSTGYFCNKTHQWHWEKTACAKTREGYQNYDSKRHIEFTKLQKQKDKKLPEILENKNRILKFLKMKKRQHSFILARM